MMPVYNVMAPVVALVNADSEEEAVAAFRAFLRSDHYDVLDGGAVHADAFLSDDQSPEAQQGALQPGQPVATVSPHRPGPSAHP